MSPIRALARLQRLPGVAMLLVATLIASILSQAEAQVRDNGQRAPEAAASESGGLVKGMTYVVDPTHTFVTYEIGHYGATTNRGRFSTLDGSMKIDDAGLAGRVDITIDINTVNTGVGALDKHLLSKDFFNIADYPTGRFVAEKVDLLNGGVGELSGSLTLLDKTLPVKLMATRFKCYVSPIFHRQVCGGDFTTVIKRSDFGILWGLNVGFDDAVHLDIQVEAVREK